MNKTRQHQEEQEQIVLGLEAGPEGNVEAADTERREAGNAHDTQGAESERTPVVDDHLGDFHGSQGGQAEIHAAQVFEQPAPESAIGYPSQGPERNGDRRRPLEIVAHQGRAVSSQTEKRGVPQRNGAA